MATGDDITGPINLGNPGEVTIRELAEMIVDLTGSRSQIVSRPLPQDDPRQRRPDIARAKSLLGWEPKVSLADGLKDTVGYFRTLLQRTSGISALPGRAEKTVSSALTMPAAP
jgi:UDP-glucuronate decarboxylase